MLLLRCLSLTLVLVTCAGAARATGSPDPMPARSGKPTSAWIANMDGLAQALVATLTDAAARPLDAARRERLRADAAVLRGLVNGLSALHERPDADPTLPLLLQELDRAVDDVARADETRIESVALALAWTCMGCHTRVDAGSSRPSTTLAPVDAGLPPDVRGIALAATRRFDEARAAFGAAAIDETLAAQEPRRWERSVRGALLLDLRMRHDPRAALAVADQVLLTPGGDSLYAEAGAWREVLVPWVKRQQRFPTTVAALTAEAARLIAEADARGPADPAVEILALQTTAIGHALLMKNPPRAVRAQAFFWLGESYARLQDLDIWSLHLAYDALCIEAAPHTPLARTCFDRWHEGALSAFAGNGGGGLPDDVVPLDEALRARAAPTPSAPKKPRSP